MISVIIPTSKRSRTLQDGLQSLQEQTLSDFEIMVVDNAADAAEVCASGLAASVRSGRL